MVKIYAILSLFKKKSEIGSILALIDLKMNSYTISSPFYVLSTFKMTFSVEKNIFFKDFRPPNFLKKILFFSPKFDPNLKFLKAQTTFFKCLEQPKYPNNPEITL